MRPQWLACVWFWLHAIETYFSISFRRKMRHLKCGPYFPFVRCTSQRAWFLKTWNWNCCSSGQVGDFARKTNRCWIVPLQCKDIYVYIFFFYPFDTALEEFKSNEIGVVMFIASSWVLRGAITTVDVKIDWIKTKNV